MKDETPPREVRFKHPHAEKDTGAHDLREVPRVPSLQPPIERGTQPPKEPLIRRFTPWSFKAVDPEAHEAKEEPNELAPRGPEKRLAHRAKLAGALAILGSVATGIAAYVGPHLSTIITAIKTDPNTHQAQVAQANAKHEEGETHAQQAALDAALVRIADLEKRAESFEKREAKNEHQQRLHAYYICKLNGTSPGPDWQCNSDAFEVERGAKPLRQKPYFKTTIGYRAPSSQ